MKIVVALFLSFAAFAQQPTVTVDRAFSPPATDDAATTATITLIGGALDNNSAPLAALSDGLLPTNEDQPSANVFFRPNSWGGRLRIDLGSAIDVAAVRTYSWHPGSRAPQVYKLYGSDGAPAGFDPAPSTKLDPTSCGWTALAFVDTRKQHGDDGGQYVVTVGSPTGMLGHVRYLLLDAFETESEDAWGQTFYSELEVLPRTPERWTAAERKEMAARVRRAAIDSWKAYKRYAWEHDELQPLSKSGKDWHEHSLLMTPVDSLDTLLLLGATAEAAEAKKLIQKLSFDKDLTVKNFEITIRLLGGLLSAYELTGDRRLLRLADDLGSRLLPVFDSPTGMPYMYVNLKSGKVRGVTSNPAEIGTLFLELGTLSRHTRKPVYFDKAKRALVALYERRSKIGLVGEEIYVETGAWVSTASHVGGGIDSYYEYLLKGWLLFGDEDCRRMWSESVKALNTYLAEEAPSGLWYGQVEMHTGKRTASEYGALHAFLPAVLALGGDVPRAARLQASCLKMWNVAGIEPEAIDYSSMKILQPGYRLRPEIVESAYTLHSLTGDPRYLDMGKTFFDGLTRYCRAGQAFTTLENVETKKQGDLMPSYFLAETLKYLYLLYAPEALDFQSVVFNTEAHPFRRGGTGKGPARTKAAKSR
jgi:mannosidase alpha-like ER degradation enhancer 2